MHTDPSALVSCIHDTLETFLADHPGCEAAEIEVARDGSSDAVRITAGGCDFLLVLLPYGEARNLGLAPQQAPMPQVTPAPRTMVDRFLFECTRRTAAANVYSSELYAAYEAWAAKAGEPVLSIKRFSAQLRAMDFDLFAGRHGKLWRGLYLTQAGAVH